MGRKVAVLRQQLDDGFRSGVSLVGALRLHVAVVAVVVFVVFVVLVVVGRLR